MKIHQVAASAWWGVEFLSLEGKKMSVYKSNDNWFVLTAGSYCGLLIKEKTAKKLQKLLWRQTQEIKELLIANKDDCVPLNWTLAYPEPEKRQTVVYFNDNDETFEDRIKHFDKSNRLSHVDNGVFLTDERGNKASEDVTRFYEKMYGEFYEEMYWDSE